MNHKKKILLSGLQPTGELHIGNYFGAMKQMVDLQNDYQCFFMIADLHALTSVQNATQLREFTHNLIITYLAIGLDPSKSVIFKQSDIKAHLEAAWVFNCITTVPYLERAHAYKDKVANGLEANVGLFTYPVLMAADILLYDADVVPVGQDQKQHIEYARDTAEKFNRIFGDTLKLPAEKIIESVAVVPGTDGQKMSKSYGNTIPLFAEPTALKTAVMSIVTDSIPLGEPLDPDTDNVFALHKLVATEAELHELAEKYRSGQIGFGDSKKLLLERLEKFIAPLRDRRQSIASDQELIADTLTKSKEAATAKASQTLERMRTAVGL